MMSAIVSRSRESGPLSRYTDVKHGIRGINNGFILWAEESPDQRQPRSALSIVGDADVERVVPGRGFDTLTMVWRSACGDRAARFAADRRLPTPGHNPVLLKEM